MNWMRSLVALSIAIAVLATSAGVAFAGPLADGIRAAEAATGGRALEASLEEDDEGGLLIEVEIIVDGEIPTIRYVVVNADGQVVENEKEDDLLEDWDVEELRALYEAVRGAISLAAAVDAAEARTNGFALGAHLDDVEEVEFEVFVEAEMNAGDSVVEVPLVVDVNAAGEVVEVELEDDDDEDDDDDDDEDDEDDDDDDDDDDDEDDD